MHQDLGGNCVRRRKTTGFWDDSHISDAVIRCKARDIGYALVKFRELISSASPVGNDEYFVSGFRGLPASRCPDFWAASAGAIRLAFEANQPRPGLDRERDLLSTREPRVATIPRR
jgi:hypothetical protein